MDNGTEFKNEQMDELCEQLNIKRVYSPVYTPEVNGRLEAWHCFFKACVAKHIRGNIQQYARCHRQTHYHRNIIFAQYNLKYHLSDHK